jgi:hypothetical protein
MFVRSETGIHRETVETHVRIGLLRLSEAVSDMYAVTTEGVRMELLDRRPRMTKGKKRI